MRAILEFPEVEKAANAGNPDDASKFPERTLVYVEWGEGNRELVEPEPTDEHLTFVGVSSLLPGDDDPAQL